MAGTSSDGVPTRSGTRGIIAHMLEGEKVLITGVTGKVAFPIARALAVDNEVWGVARLRGEDDRAKLGDAGITAVALDVSTADFASSLPDDFTYVFHAAVDPGMGQWQPCVRTNAHNSGELLYHCRSAKGFVYCSTGSVYAYQGQPLRESDGPGVPLRGNYSFSKVAGEAVCTWISEHFGIPLTIIRICSTYGPLGGSPADRLDMMLQGTPIRLYPDTPNNYNPIYEDDYVRLGVRALLVGQVPPLVVNWAGSETVSIEDYCAYMGELVGVEPTFEYTPEAHTPLWPDVTLMHEVLGRTKTPWRDGFRRMIEARHPELVPKMPER